VPYEVPCVCGRLVRGERRRRHQVVPCPGCGRPVFVLPLSPWSAARPPALPRPWRAPLLAGLLSLLGLVALFLLLLPRVRRAPGERAGPPGAEEVLRLMESGREALAQGNVHLALRRLNDAVDLRDRRPGVLSPAQHRRLNQLQRQSDLLARLSAHSLEEVVRQAALVRHPEEWEARFAEQRDKAVVFDDVVARDDLGRPALSGYEVRVDGEKVRVALEDLALLRELPLGQPRRMLFGARLARVGREDGGEWVVRFRPDSAVLLTDPDAAGACCPLPLDEGLLETLARQERWLGDVARLRPAPPTR
jgi:hypothetical protein